MRSVTIVAQDIKTQKENIYSYTLCLIAPPNRSCPAMVSATQGTPSLAMPCWWRLQPSSVIIAIYVCM